MAIYGYITLRYGMPDVEAEGCVVQSTGCCEAEDCVCSTGNNAERSVYGVHRLRSAMLRAAGGDYDIMRARLCGMCCIECHDWLYGVYYATIT